jgi:hypothetical protein
MIPRRRNQISYASTYRLDAVPGAGPVEADVECLLARLVAQAYLKDHSLAQREQTGEDQDAAQKA